MDNIRIRVGDSEIYLDEAFRWQPDKGGDEAQQQASSLLASMANSWMLLHYQYSPSHGQPGHLAASQVARAVRGQVILPPVPEGRKDVVY